MVRVKETYLRILILVEDYHNIYCSTVREQLNKSNLSYKELVEHLFSNRHYQSDTYSDGMLKNGEDALQIIATCEPIQKKWAAENDISVLSMWTRRAPFRWYWTKIKKEKNAWSKWYEDILLAQIKDYNPDVVYVFSGVRMTQELAANLKKHCSLLVCQWCSPILQDYPYEKYDLIISCAQFMVDIFEERGIQAEYLPHCFDTRILHELSTYSLREERNRSVVFSGSLLPGVHDERINLINFLAEHISIKIYTPRRYIDSLSSNARRYYSGTLNGIEMYKQFHSAGIVVHNHGTNGYEKRGGGDAHAKRLFEVTGSGALLFTDKMKTYKPNFDVGQDIVVYENKEDCLDRIIYYMKNINEAEIIAKKGQSTTVNKHNHVKRMNELISILKAYI